MGILSWLKGAIHNLFNKNDAAKRLGINIPECGDMEKAIRLWAELYENVPCWACDNVISMNAPYSVAHEMARLVTLEFSSELSGSPRADYLSTYYKKIVESSPEWVEYACALGGVMLKPYVTAEGIVVDYVRADAFTPCAYDGTGNITACIFSESITRSSKYYTRIEYHELKGGNYAIVNKAFVSDNKSELGREISLETIPEWSGIAEETHLTGIKHPLFVYMRIPGGNIIDRYSPLGVSVYNAAVDVFKEIDKQFSRLIWEFEGSELAVFADETMFRPDNNTVPRINKRLFKGINSAEDDMFNVFSPAIRDSSLINGLNELTRKMEFLCGLAYGTFSTVEDSVKTATEIKVSRQRSYATVASIQKAVQKALTEYAQVLDILCDLYQLAPKGNIEQSFSFDDSLITDTESEQKIRMQEVAAGIIKAEQYIMWRYGVTEEQAKEMMPESFGDDV